MFFDGYVSARLATHSILLLALTVGLAHSAALSGCASGGTSGGFGVDDGGGGSGAKAQDYAPFELGATWTYAVEILGDTSKDPVRIRIVDKVDGYYRDSANAEYRHTPSGLRDRKRYLIRNPLRVGQKWKATLSPTAVENYTIESVGEPCETSAGPFDDCLVVNVIQRRKEGEVQHTTFTWVRGVGLARVLVEGEVAGRPRFKQSELSLIEYRPSGEAPVTDDEGAPTEWTQ